MLAKRRVLATGHIGSDFDRIAEITYPAMRSYADRHGMWFSGAQLTPRGGRPAPWLKLERIAECFVDFDEVLWLDTDVLVVDESLSIFSEFTDEAIQALADVTAYPERHLNTGVWALRKHMLPYLLAAAMSDEFVHHSWWEQAAMHHLMRTHHIPTTVLGEEWNHWDGSPAEIRPRFKHACGLAMPHVRLQKLEEWRNAAH